MKFARNLALAGGLLFAATASYATTYFIGPTRGATRDQLTDIAHLLNPGDIVELDGSANGAPANLYNTVRFERSGTAANPIVIRGVVPPGGRRPVIRGGNWTLHVKADHYVVENVEAAEAVTGQGSSRCVYLEGFNITFRNSLVRDCVQHGILVADYLSGDIVIDGVEVTRIATGAGGSDQYHAMYVSTDISEYPNATVTVRNSIIHGSASGNGIKSRAGRTNVYNNWVEIKGNFYPVQINGSEEHDCIIARGDGTNRGCDADIVGNTFIAHGSNIFNVGDGTGENRGRVRVVNNTFVSGASLSDNYIRIRGPIDSLEMHNNILYMQRGTTVNTFVRDIEAVWLRGSRTIVGANNVVTITQNFPNWGLTGTVYAHPANAAVLKTISFVNDAELMDVGLAAGSVARNIGNTSGTNLPGFEIVAPMTVPLAQPPRFKPSPGAMNWSIRPAARNLDGTLAAGKISAGAFEVPAGPARPVRSDIDGNRRSDIVWYNTANGILFDMRMNGLAIESGVALYQNPVVPDYAPLGMGDMDGDGHVEMFWRDMVSGDVDVQRFYVNGVPLVDTNGYFQEPDLGWKVEQIADADGDGRVELIWRHQGTGQVRLGGSVFYIEPNQNWKIVASGDMNGDGRADLLWRNLATGDVFAQLLCGLCVPQGNVIYTEPNLNWTIVGLADFNGDGRADVLWRNTATGDVFQMQMNGTLVSAGQVIYNEPSQDWKIVALGDYNGDGRADILWRNSASGQVYMMLMNGFTISAGDFIYTEPNQQWTILGP